MDKTQNIFEKVRERLKKYRFNWSTQEVEQDEFIEIEHVNHCQTLNSDTKRRFKLRGSAVVVCTFLVLVGAGVVDAQTRAYEVIYKGTSIGCVDSLDVLQLAVSDTNDSKSGRRNREGSDYEIRMARSTDFLTTEEVAQVIKSIRAQEKTVQVARAESVAPTVEVAPPETHSAETEQLETVSTEVLVEEEPVVEPVMSTANTPEIQTAAESDRSETPVVEEEPAVDLPEVETPQIETVVEGIQTEQNPAAVPVEENKVVEIPVVEPKVPELPAEVVVDNPAVEPQVPETPVEPVTEVPPVEAPAEGPPVESPAEEPETPQVQFILPASGRVGEILRNYDGGYYSNHYRAAAIDILNSEGTAIYAAASGTVTLSSWYGGYGKCVIIDHGNGYSTLYGHFSSVDVSEGETVTQGQRIGGMGSTGSSTANHVHFEVRENNEAQPISHYFNVSSGDYI
ncbi:MAG: hypothetical protein PWP56_1855 [Acetobacterium sp.]|jgi:murein DD-endopeptidase MepM/ murein hydrolase activator NlpD|nr:hypothetical protein [Acetobacterium sp.]